MIQRKTSSAFWCRSFLTTSRRCGTHRREERSPTFRDVMPDGVDALATRFAEVVPLEFNTSPLYQALGPVVAGNRALLEMIATRSAGQQPTNLFFAALHYLLLHDREHPLREFFP